LENAFLAIAFCHVMDFVVAMAGEVYDAHEQEVQIGNPGLPV
jgi:hypothetical protein